VSGQGDLETVVHLRHGLGFVPDLGTRVALAWASPSKPAAKPTGRFRLHPLWIRKTAPNRKFGVPSGTPFMRAEVPLVIDMGG
jgi:hypothetical protein